MKRVFLQMIDLREMGNTRLISVALTATVIAPSANVFVGVNRCEPSLSAMFPLSLRWTISFAAKTARRAADMKFLLTLFVTIAISIYLTHSVSHLVQLPLKRFRKIGFLSVGD